jgi:hypothetical protein
MREDLAAVPAILVAPPLELLRGEFVQLGDDFSLARSQGL